MENIVERVNDVQQESKYQIEMVAPKHRHMSNWDMFATWIGANANNGVVRWWCIGCVWFIDGA